jgi:hypothetical protein
VPLCGLKQVCTFKQTKILHYSHPSGLIVASSLTCARITLNAETPRCSYWLTIKHVHVKCGCASLHVRTFLLHETHL